MTYIIFWGLKCIVYSGKKSIKTSRKRISKIVDIRGFHASPWIAGKQITGNLFFSCGNENFMPPVFHLGNKMPEKMNIRRMPYAKKYFQLLFPIWLTYDSKGFVPTCFPDFLSQRLRESPFLTTFFTYCQTSSFIQGNRRSSHRWGWVLIMIRSGSRPCRARSARWPVLFTGISNPESTWSRMLAPALFHFRPVSVR